MKTMATAILMVCCTLSALSCRGDGPSEFGFYIGSYTGAKSKGIYYASLDAKLRKLTSPVLAAESQNPAFLAAHPGGKWLYAANEIGNFEGKDSGAISAYRIDPATHRLVLLNQKPTRGGGPCHLTVTATGSHVLAANYGGGSTVALPILEDGRLGDPVSFIQHQGSSINLQRQKEPHAHGVYMDKSGTHALVADLGLDKILVYRFDSASGSLTPGAVPWASLKPGAGPRHLALHPGKDYGYAINELDSTVTGFAFDLQRAGFKEFQTITTLPSDYKGVNYPAEIQIHPTGKFVYGSNRGHNSIVVYSVDIGTGALTFVECVSTQGKNPRHFAIDPSGKYLIAANQDSNSLVLFGINTATGQLAPTGAVVDAGSPVCIEFVR